MNLPPILSGRRRRLFVQLLLNGLCQAGIAVAIALFIRMGVGGSSRTLSGTDDGMLLGIFGLLLAGPALIALRAAERADAERLGQHYMAQVRLKLFDSVAAVPGESPSRRRHGLMMVRAVSDLASLKNWVSQGLARILVASVTLAGALTGLALLSPAMAALAGVITLACLAAGLALTRPLHSRIRELRRRRGQLASNLGEKFLAIQVVRHFGQAAEERRRLRRQSRRLAQAAACRALVSGLLRSLPDGALLLAAAGLLAVSAAGWETRELSVATIAGCLLTLGILFGALRDLARAWDYRLNFDEGARRLATVLGGTPRPGRAGSGVLDGEGRLTVALHDVSAGAVLESATATAPAGAVVALVGPNAAAKSMLLALLAGTKTPRRGRVTLNGRSPKTVCADALARAVKLVSPDLPLLHGTVADNIAYGAGDLVPNQIGTVTELCGIAAAPELARDGSATRIAERGANLPAGLRARLSLARAVANRPRLLLIDDPALFSDAEGRAALSRVVRGRSATTIVAVPHGAPAIDADWLWRFEGGRLVDVRKPGAPVVELRPTVVAERSA